MSFKKKAIDKLSNTWVDRVIGWLYASLELRAMGAFHQDVGLQLIKEIRKEDGFLMCRPSEMYIIHSLANAQQTLAGDYAEVGVYRGATARLICEVKGDKHLLLFDTFEGLPKLGEDDIRFSEKMFTAGLDRVKRRLSPFQNVFFYQGVFPKTAESAKDRRFAFVHLDVDLYQSTKDALDFFYPRLVPGGVLISHDFPSADGVRRAFIKFLSDKPEKIIGLPLSQGMIVKQGTL